MASMRKLQSHITIPYRLVLTRVRHKDVRQILAKLCRVLGGAAGPRNASFVLTGEDNVLLFGVTAYTPAWRIACMA